MIVKTTEGQKSSLEFQEIPHRVACKCCKPHLNGKAVYQIYLYLGLAWLYYKGDRKAYSGRQRSCDYSQEEHNVPTRNRKTKSRAETVCKTDEMCQDMRRLITPW